MIHIRINSEIHTLEKSSSLLELLKAQGYVNNHIAVALNGSFISKSLYQKTIIQSGDAIEIVSPMQGG